MLQCAARGWSETPNETSQASDQRSTNSGGVKQNERNDLFLVLHGFFSLFPGEDSTWIGQAVFQCAIIPLVKF